MSASNGWDAYIPLLLNMWSKKQEQFIRSNVSEHAAIIGLDGTTWASSPKWPGLNEYDHPLEGDDGSVTTIKINELECAKAASNGQRNPTAAGIRMGSIKFMLVSHEAEENLAYLSRMGGGGACVVRTKSALVISMWNKN